MTQRLPEELSRFMREACAIRTEAFRSLPPAELPERDRRLLVHTQDMTSTLAAFHGSALWVEVLQQRQTDGFYLREVFLRSEKTNSIVEYGVIAVAMAQFTPVQQAAIRAGRTPLGALLHQFRIPFASGPMGFFSATGDALVTTPLHPLKDAACFGRFNLLSKPGGDPLAWIVEILPPPAA